MIWRQKKDSRFHVRAVPLTTISKLWLQHLFFVDGLQLYFMTHWFYFNEDILILNNRFFGFLMDGVKLFKI